MAYMFPPRQRAVKEYPDRRDVTSANYRRQFRFEPPTVSWLNNYFIGPETTETRGAKLTNKHKMESFLRYASDPGFQHSVSEAVGSSQPSVSRRINYVINKICDKCSEWIDFPTTQQQFDDVAAVWNGALPRWFGAVDGCLIKIAVPLHQFCPAEYFSGRKKITSIIKRCVDNELEKLKTEAGRLTENDEEQFALMASRLDDIERRLLRVEDIMGTGDELFLPKL